MRFLILTLIIAFSFPVMAYDFTSEKIEGVSLDMNIDQAREILITKGYKEYKSPYESDITKEQGSYTFTKDLYSITVSRGLVLSHTALIKGATVNNAPNLLVSIVLKKQHGHSKNENCTLPIKAIDKFCNDNNIDVQQKECKDKTLLNITYIQDDYTFKHNALAPPGSPYCQLSVSRIPTYKN